MARKPSHLVQAGAAAQPARRCEVTQRVRVEAPVMGKTGLGAQPMKDLRKVPLL